MCFLSHISYVEKYHSLLAVFFQSDSNAARRMARDCGRSLAGMTSSKPQGTWISLSCDCCVLCRYRLLRVADPSTKEVLQSVYVYVPASARACVLLCENALHLQCVSRKSESTKPFFLGECFKEMNEYYTEKQDYDTQFHKLFLYTLPA